ncbi:MAG: AsmA family protein, partial [Candidatus Cloacimonetes bacterium]|nr:AsmA family protein [Candidatus Cloacimonadota bacterium]
MMKKPIKRFLLIILILILLLVIIVAGLFIFRNQIATFVIEKSGSAVAGARVEVDNLYMKPFKLHISWERFQVTNKNDTWRNLFETAKCEFSLAFKPLWDRKVIIEKMKMETVQFDTKRSTDGKLPIKKKKPKKPSKLLLAIKKNLEREKQQIPVFNPKFLKTKIDVDSLMQVLNFQTPAKADSLKKLAE